MHPTQNVENNSGNDHGHDGRDLQEVHSQTDSSTNAQHQLSQTDKVNSQDSNVQTRPVNTQQSSVQTAPRDEKQTAQQTEKATLSEQNTQTIYPVRVIEPSADASSQAGHYQPVDSGAQTQQSISLMVEGLSQTELEQADNVTQTEAKVTGDRFVQVQPDQSVSSSQTVRDEGDAVCQTEVYQAEAVLQTDYSMANQVEGAAQATVDMVVQEVQASVDCYVVEAQTDSSMALLRDQGAQAVVDLTECDMQTDAAQIQESCVQTELETAERDSQTVLESANKDSQTEQAVADMECQTEVQEEPSMPIIENVPQVEVAHEATVETEIPDDVAVGASQNSTSSGGYSSSQVLQIVPEFSEEGCQTDPVTIIIGDASFLVNKLKSSSLSPTKVSSMGNEIEIELRADEEEATPYDMPDPVQPPRTRGSPMPYRARGVRTRGGAHRGVTYSRGGGVVGGSPGNPHPQRGSPRGRGSYYPSSAGVLGKYSCPVCSETFHESPALYEHLQVRHAEAFNLIKKPKGREGKTIQMKPTLDPPVLTPMEPIGMAVSMGAGAGVGATHQVEVYSSEPTAPTKIEVVQQEIQPQEVQQQEVIHQEFVPQEVAVQQEVQVQQQQVIVQEDPQDVALFEETFQSPNKARKRTLARRQVTDGGDSDPAPTLVGEEEVVIQTVDSPLAVIEKEPAATSTPATNKRKPADAGLSPDGADRPQRDAKRIRSSTDTEPESTEAPNLQPEESATPQDTPKRRSRASVRGLKPATPAAAKEEEKSAEAASPAVASPEVVKTPRPRGRPRKSDTVSK